MTHRKARRETRESATGGTGLWLLAAAILLAVLGVTAWWWATQSGAAEQTAATDPTKAGPRLALDTARIDLGKQPFDKTVRAEFKVQNTGDQPLKLDASTPIRVVEGC